jgi:hypothetical protein
LSKEEVALYAYFVPGKGLWPRLFEESLQALPLLRVELSRFRSVPSRRLIRRLRRSGVKGFLNGPEWLSLVTTAPLYRRKAAQLALAVLEGRGLEPERAVVGLMGRRWSAEMERCAGELVQRVRCLALDLPRSEGTEWELRRRWGVSAVEGEGDVTVCFSPAEPGENRLLLGEERPSVEGISWHWRGGALPEGAPVDALLTLLAQSGRIGWEEIEAEGRGSRGVG